MIVTLVLDLLVILLVVFLTIFAGWRKSPDPEDTFCDNYTSFWRANLAIQICIVILYGLTCPVLYEYVMLMIETMGDLDFLKNELPKLDGCISPLNVEQVIRKGHEEVNDQLIMHFIIVGLQGLTVFFFLFTLTSVILRRRMEKKREEKEYKL